MEVIIGEYNNIGYVEDQKGGIKCIFVWDHPLEVVGELKHLGTVL